MSRLIYIQDLILTKLHPAFVKGTISILIGALTFLSVYFGTDEADKYVGSLAQWVIIGILGLFATMANQFRDSISAYYTDKNKPPTNPPTNTTT